jgi:hypothetical protein
MIPLPINDPFSISPGKKHGPGLLIMFMFLSSVSMAMSKQQHILPDTVPPLLLTVADIGVLPGNTTYYRVSFYQSARFYKLMRTNKNCKQALLLLERSRKTNKPVLVILTEKYGDVIDLVKKNSN